MKILCCYHGGCPDGLGAAAVIGYHYPQDDITYFPCQYGDPFPVEDPRGYTIFVVDFSFAREILDGLVKHNTLIVLDHHKTAEEALKGAIYAVFDQDHSGAVLAWKWHSVHMVPAFLEYLEDRDLWRWKLPHSREIAAATSLKGFGPERIPEWIGYIRSFPMQAFIETGRAVLEHTNSLVEKLCRASWPAVIDGHPCRIVASPLFQSEVGERLLQMHPEIDVAVIYQDKPQDLRVFSLRARAGGVDVSEIAKKNGGGGHRVAAGFTSTIWKMVG